MVVVDTHCHVSLSWREPVETLLDQMSRNRVDKATLIQVSTVHDNSYYIECMRRFPGRFSVVAGVDTARTDAPERLEEWVKQGAEGIRLRPTVRSPGADPLAIWRKASDLGIVVSSQGSLEESASPEFENIIKEFPNLTIIIEHLGHSGKDKAPYIKYRRVLELAQYPNTFMKVPGLGEISHRRIVLSHLPFAIEDAPPLIEMAIDAFGPRRLMWGSNFPYVIEGYGHALRWPMEHVQFKSEGDKEWIFGKTATTLFRFGK